MSVFLLSVMGIEPARAQTTSSGEKYNLIVSDQPLVVVLEQLSRMAGVTFSYNPDQVGVNRKITLRITGKTLDEIMQQLFDEDIFDFRRKGSQVVIYKKTEKVTPIGEKVQPVDASSKQPDTVYLIKEQRVTDTVVKIEIQSKTDTVYLVEKQPEPKIGSKDIFRNNPPMYARLKPQTTFDAGFKFSGLLSYRNFSGEEQYKELLNTYRDADSGFAFSGAAGLTLQLNYQRLSFITGVEMVQLAYRFNYNFSTSTGGFYLKDTLDAYYTLIDNDTTWFYLIDSSYQPLDVQQYRYNTLVKYRYLDFPIVFQYNVPLGRNLVYFKGGLIAGVSVGKTGYYLSADTHRVTDLKSLKTRPLLMSALLGGGITLPISSKIIFSAGMYYRYALQSVYKDFEIKTYPAALGADVSLMIRL